MTEMLRRVRVFLASPGDLPEERRAIKEIESELNNGIASFLGFRVEIKGWEDTLSGYGRPQGIINQELDLCELFIGMMYSRWGTPPSGDGRYTSGFEEEFERTFTRRGKTGVPEMTMYFKLIDDKLLVDPGEELKKVMTFKKRIASERTIYYEDFEDSNDVQKRVRRKIESYLMDFKKSEVERQEEEKAKTKKPTEDVSKTREEQPIKSPFSLEGHRFLEHLLKKTETENDFESVTSLEVARFRLLSSVISASGNDEHSLGVHDANIIYSNKDIELGFREISELINSGLRNIRHENVPFWHWCDLYKHNVDMVFLPFRTFGDDVEVRVGAFEAMKLTGESIPIDKESDIDRNSFIEEWLSPGSAERVRLAALSYLKHHGTDEDVPLIQSELNRANPKTSRSALESIVGIQLRYNKSQALKTAIENQFESFDDALLEDAFSAISMFDDDILRLGLKHGNNRIRLECLKRLKESEKINPDEIQELQDDPFAKIRKEIVDFLLLNHAPLNNDAVKRILVKPTKSPAFRNYLQPTPTDDEGQGCYDGYLYSKYFDMSEKELLDVIREGAILEEIPYLALHARYFRKYSDALRQDVDEQFGSKFEDYVSQLKKLGFTEENIQKSSNLEDFIRRKLTRKALDILCKKGDGKELHRIRKIMRSEYVKSSKEEIEYMRKWGEWEDIPFIIKAEQDHASSRTALTLMSIDYKGWRRSIAQAIYSIGKDRLEELLKLEMPSWLVVHLIEVSSKSDFSGILDEEIFNLLNNEDDKVRKSVSLKCIQSFNKNKLKSLLEQYVEGQEQRFYNVIHWLDFGVSMPKPITKKAIDLILRAD